MLFFKPTLKSFLRGREKPAGRNGRGNVSAGPRIRKEERWSRGGFWEEKSMRWHQQVMERNSRQREPVGLRETQGKSERGEDPYPHLQGHPHPHLSSTSLCSHHPRIQGSGRGSHLGVRQTFRRALKPAGPGCYELAGGNWETLENFIGQLLVT